MHHNAYQEDYIYVTIYNYVLHVPSHAQVWAGPTIDGYEDSFSEHLCHCKLAVGDGGWDCVIPLIIGLHRHGGIGDVIPE